MLLWDIIPQLPETTPLTLMYVGGALGTILLVYAIFLEKEYKQDLALSIGAALLFVYAWYIKNIFFMISMAGLSLAALIEYWQIFHGSHHHSKKDIKEYKKT